MIFLSTDTITHYPALKAAGLIHRKSTEGAEKDLVDDFIRATLASAPASQSPAVFVEPRLETGFPDVVLVYLDQTVIEQWNTGRAKLGKREICLLHHLARAGPQPDERLRFLFPEGVRPALAKLQAAGLVRTTKAGWKALPTRRLLAVRRIIAIEAKVGAWQAGLEQAFRNRWFASESYLLLPSVPKSEALRHELRTSGVGLLTAGTTLDRPVVRPTKSKLPGSYASWLFNEWACNASVITTSPSSYGA